MTEQWILKLVESDTPELAMDAEIRRSGKTVRNRGKETLGFDARRSPGQSMNLIDLAVLSFPSATAPHFKVDSVVLHVHVSASNRNSSVNW